MKITSLLKELNYLENRPAVTLLIESEFSKEIRIAMKQGQRMKEHQTPHPIVIQVVKGAVDFGVEGKVFDLITGDILTLEGSVPHDLYAKKDSILRLSLSLSDRAQRVKEVAEEE